MKGFTVKPFLFAAILTVWASIVCADSAVPTTSKATKGLEACQQKCTSTVTDCVKSGKPMAVCEQPFTECVNKCNVKYPAPKPGKGEEVG